MYFHIFTIIFDNKVSSPRFKPCRDSYKLEQYSRRKPLNSLIKLFFVIEISIHSLYKSFIVKMDEFHIPYSQKNIPLHSKNNIRKQLVKRTEDFVSRMRWHLYHIRNPLLDPTLLKYFDCSPSS